MSSIKIRRAVLADASHLPGIFEEAIRQIASRFYSIDQVNAWAGRAWRLQEVFEQDFNARTAWVAEDQTGRLLAYLDLEGGGHIDFFYALPDVTRTDITRDMYALLEAEARAQGVARLTTEASEAAKRFFEKQGFVVSSRNDVVISGVSIYNYRMEKALLPNAPQTGTG